MFAHASSHGQVGPIAFAAMLLALSACNSPIAHRPPGAAPGEPVHDEVVRGLDERGSVATGELSPNAQKLHVGCATCHSLRGPTKLPDSATALDEFHVGLEVRHGDLSCASCHTPNRVEQLRLADGSAVEPADIMALCGQCHGPQRRDYAEGAHGGMSGYWDRSRGPRTRNSCTSCHDPHAPAYVGGQPVLPPRDRFLDWSDHQ